MPKRNYDKEEKGFKQKLIRFPDDLWKVVQDYRFDKRVKDEAATVRRLVRKGLAAEGFVVPPNDEDPEQQ